MVKFSEFDERSGARRAEYITTGDKGIKPKSGFYPLSWGPMANRPPHLGKLQNPGERAMRRYAGAVLMLWTLGGCSLETGGGPGPDGGGGGGGGYHSTRYGGGYSPGGGRHATPPPPLRRGA